MESEEDVPQYDQPCGLHRGIQHGKQTSIRRRRVIRSDQEPGTFTHLVRTARAWPMEGFEASFKRFHCGTLATPSGSIRKSCRTCENYVRNNIALCSLIVAVKHQQKIVISRLHDHASFFFLSSSSYSVSLLQHASLGDWANVYAVSTRVMVDQDIVLQVKAQEQYLSISCKSGIEVSNRVCVWWGCCCYCVQLASASKGNSIWQNSVG